MQTATKRSKRGVTWLPFVAACAGAVVLWSWVAGSGSQPTARKAAHIPDAGDARAYCESFLKGAVHDPTRFEAIDSSRWPAATVADEIGRWRVRATFRASNGYGAIRATQATCVLDVSGDRWRLVDLQQD